MARKRKGTFQDLSRLPDISERDKGKQDVAPCGHQGEYVFNNYIKCLHGCDSIPEEITPEDTKKICTRHGNKMYYRSHGMFDTRSYCSECNEEIV